MILLLVAVISGQLSTPLNLNGQSITRASCDGGITCAKSGQTLTIIGTGSGGGGVGGAPVDGGYVVWSATATSGSTNERVLTAGTNVTLDTATPGQLVVNASGGAGSVNTATGTAAFDGGSKDAYTTVAAAWVTGASVITCTPTGEEASVEGLVVTVLSKSAGSFIVRAEPRNGTHWGALPFECVGN
jgi:hypothetical protein